MKALDNSGSLEVFSEHGQIWFEIKATFPQGAAVAEAPFTGTTMRDTHWKNRHGFLNSRALRILGVLIQHPGLSLREMIDQTGISMHGIHYHLCRMERMGLVSWEAGRSRTARVKVTVEAV